MGVEICLVIKHHFLACQVFPTPSANFLHIPFLTFTFDLLLLSSAKLGVQFTTTLSYTLTIPRPFLVSLAETNLPSSPFETANLYPFLSDVIHSPLTLPTYSYHQGPIRPDCLAASTTYLSTATVSTTQPLQASSSAENPPELH